MTIEKSRFEKFIAENLPIQELPTIVEKKELTPQEETELASAAIEAIGGNKKERVDLENWKDEVEASILDGVHGLPEMLAEKLKTVDASALNNRARELIALIAQERSPERIAELQTELIFQFIGIISRVQNGGDKGFTPSIAKEADGLDCSLSAWALKEKLRNSGAANTSFEFGYLPGHAVGMVTLANDRKLYVDAQNGIVEAVTLEKVTDESYPDTAYPIFEITSRERIVGQLPNEAPTIRTNTAGSDYTPRFIGIREDGTLHTLGNMHMFANPSSPTFYSETARDFRKGIGMPEPDPGIYEAGKTAMGKWQADHAKDDELQKYFAAEMGSSMENAREYADQWRNYYAKFENLVERVAGGKTIYETRFGELEEKRHLEFQELQRKAADQRRIDEIKHGLGI